MNGFRALHDAAPAESCDVSLSSVERASRGVIAAVFLHEAKLAARSFRLWAPSLLLVVLMLLGAVTSATYHRQEAAAQADLAKAQGASIEDAVDTLQPALKPPWRLALVVDGGQATAPDVYLQALSALAEPELRAAAESPRLPSRSPVDWLFGIRIVLSIGAFLLCHGAVCGERQSGTLKLLFSYPVPRWKFLAGKFLAAWVCLAVPFLVGAALSFCVAAGLGEVQFSGGDLARAGVGVLLGFWTAAFFVLVALLVSLLTRDPFASLGVLSLLWVAIVVVVPALGVLLARRLQPLPTDTEVNQKMDAARLQAGREFSGQGGRWRQHSWAVVDGYAWEKLSAQVENRRVALQDTVRREVLHSKMRQASLARALACVSPPSLVQEIAERLTGTGLERDRAFLAQARAFRAVLAEEVRRLDAADPASPHVLFFRGYMSHQPLAANALPRFSFRERTLEEGLVSARSVLLVFSVETFVLAVATVLAFSRYDVG